MPGATPYFGIRHPCYGDTVTVADFKNLADDVDAALTVIKALEAQAIGTPMVKVARVTGSQNVAAATNADLIYDTVLYDSGGWANLGVSNTLVTTPVSGVFYVVVGFTELTSYTTLTGMRCSIFFGASLRGENKKATVSGPTSVDAINAFAPYPAAAAVQIKNTFRWSGTGGPAAVVGATLAVYKLCDL